MNPYTPRSGRKSPIKQFYVFFCMGSKYEGKYAMIHAGSLAKAADAALRRFGHLTVAGVEPGGEHAHKKVKAYKLSEVTEII